MNFTRNERAMHKAQTLEQYQTAVIREAARRLDEEHSIATICLDTKPRMIGDFESDVQNMVMDTVYWETGKL